MEFLFIANIAAAVAAFAKFAKGRSAIYWFLGVTALLTIGEIPLRLMLLAHGARIQTIDERLATAIVVYGLLGTVAFLLACGARKRAS